MEEIARARRMKRMVPIVEDGSDILLSIPSFYKASIEYRLTGYFEKNKVLKN